MTKIINFKNRTVHEVPSKKKSFSSIKKIFAFIIGIIPIILIVLQIHDWCTAHKPVKVVVQDNIKLSYISKNDERFNDIYPLFEDYIEVDKEYSFSENCATQLMITNHYNTQIVLDKIILEVEQIDVDYRPVLNFQSGYDTEDGVSVVIANIGWEDVNNLTVKGKVRNDGTSASVSEDYFKDNTLEFFVPTIRTGEYIEVPFLKNSDLIKACDDSTSFHFDFEVECDNDDLPLVQGSASYVIYNGKLTNPGIGGPSKYAYGIKIDTDNNRFYWEDAISELIDTEETLVIPICFYPDKSCTMKFKILFEVVNDGNKTVISTPLTKTTFSVSSIPGYNHKEVMHSIDEAYINDSECCLISYPKNNALIVSD